MALQPSRHLSSSAVSPAPGPGVRAGARRQEKTFVALEGRLSKPLDSERRFRIEPDLGAVMVVYGLVRPPYSATATSFPPAFPLSGPLIVDRSVKLAACSCRRAISRRGFARRASGKNGLRFGGQLGQDYRGLVRVTIVPAMSVSSGPITRTSRPSLSINAIAGKRRMPNVRNTVPSVSTVVGIRGFSLAT